MWWSPPPLRARISLAVFGDGAWSSNSVHDPSPFRTQDS